MSAEAADQKKRRRNEPPVLPTRVLHATGTAATTLPCLDDVGTRLRVLVADDEQLVRDIYREFLLEPVSSATQRGPLEPDLDVVFCEQAEEAVAQTAAAAAAAEPFAIAFLDVRMPPGQSGVWAAERIRALDASTELVIVTAHSDITPLDIAARVPPVEKLLYLQKPIHPHEMSQCVAALGAKWRAERQLRWSQARLATAQRIARFAHWEWNPVTGQACWSSELNRIFGLPADLKGGPIRTLWERIHPADEAQVALGIQRVLSEGDAHSLEYRVRLPDGEERSVQHEIVTVHGQSGKALRVVGAVQDVTERKASERQILQLAYFDQVTQIPNRSFLSEHLPLVLRQAARHERNAAVLYIDLDNFKRINDTFGHGVGDEVLSETARRLRRCIRDSDCVVRPDLEPTAPAGDSVARLGGDEFIALLTEVAHPEDAARVARRILESLEQAFEIAGEQLFVHASIGIAVFPQDGTNPETLLKNADAAMYHAKNLGRNNYQFYTESLNARASERLALEKGLRQALERNELALHYQPKLELRDGRVVGAEALLRWQHPTLGLVPPDQFLAVAEESGLIVRVGEWVLLEACRQAREWEQRGLPPLRIAVNLSFRQFKDGRLIARLRDTLSAAGVTPGCLEIELGESVLMDDAEDSGRILAEIQRMGVRIVMDDFGTGRSSVAQLKRLPIASVKIDRSLVGEMLSTEESQTIVAAMIALAHRIGLEVVGEGVESPEQLEFLRSHGCEIVQGYLVSPPLPAEDFERLFREGRARLDL